MMKLRFVFLFALVFPCALFAQDVEENTFTDEDLTKYATVMKWAQDQTSSLSARVSDSLTIWIEEYDGFTASVYNQLSKAENLNEVNDVSPELKEAFQQIQTRLEAKKELLTSSFKEIYVTKIKEEIGAGLYNNLKKALKSDDSVKERYDAILASLEGTEEAESDRETTESN